MTEITCTTQDDPEIGTKESHIPVNMVYITGLLAPKNDPQRSPRAPIA